MQFPSLSVVIPTYNSSKTLELTLKSIKRQIYPSNKIEILIIDGGSQDNTLEIAQDYNCKIIFNKKTDMTNGKHLGLLEAKSKYLLFLDADERLENRNSITKKIDVFGSDKDVRAVVPSGYKSPKYASPINDYINEFGDPFYFFMHRESKGHKYLLKDLEKKYQKIKDTESYSIFNFENVKRLPLIELWAGGCMIDLEYIKFHCPQVKKTPSLVPLIFYLLNHRTVLVGVTKGDPTLHNSASGVYKYLKKMKSRVEFSVFLTELGKGGYYGREKYLGNRKYKKYLFIPYSFSIIFPLIDSIYLVSSRRKLIFSLHLPLCIYVSLLIVYFGGIKLFKIKHKMKLYGH